MPNFPLAPSSNNCCAIVITYNADVHFFERLQRICEQFSFIVIVDNHSKNAFQTQLQTFCERTLSTQLKLIQNPDNRGIAKALNQGIDDALSKQCEWVIAFDQDSLIYPELLSELTAIYHQLEPKPVILGCNYFHEALNRPAVSPLTQQSFIERKTLITSGTLIWLQLTESIGQFREDYFIDSVDHEFSLRTRQHGHSLWMSSKVLMRHTIGTAATYQRPLPFRIPEHSALRKYYITRNCLVTAFLYCRREPLWCLRQLARLNLELLTIILFEQAKLPKIAAMCLGLSHALKGKMGKLTYQAWINDSLT